MAWSKAAQSAYMKVYLAEHGDEIRARKRASRAADPLKIHATQNAYYQAHKEEIQAKRRVKYHTEDARVKRRHRLREKLYGLSPDDYERMLEAQGHRCAICEREQKLHVDHDHETGAVRALLCGPCNTALGLMRENTSALLSMVRYINRQAVQAKAAEKNGVQQARGTPQQNLPAGPGGLPPQGPPQQGGQ